MSREGPRVSRGQVVAFRRRVQALDDRLPSGAETLRTVAWAGLQDSMPRAALASLHARVRDVVPAAVEDPALVQVWGPRFQVFVVARQDVAPFTVGRHPDQPRARRRAEQMADAVETALAGRELPDRHVGAALGTGNALRYASTTGRLLIRWGGARAPFVRVVARPSVEPAQARRELARRYLHVYGPSDPEAFARWAGVSIQESRAAFAGLDGELLPVGTPVGDRFVLAADEDSLRASPAEPAPARLLPSGDAFFLLWGADRELLEPDPALRERLWTSRVWPGAVLVRGEVAGTWRRARAAMTVEPWRDLTTSERVAVEQEAATLPLPGLPHEIRVRWVD